MILSKKKVENFRRLVLDHYREHRRNLPWRRTKNPYRILLSEIMLQQTQADRVVQFYECFLRRFPTIHRLASASVRDVLAAWQGLGYNRRALALHKTAKRILAEYQGKIPNRRDALEELPGIGPGTAGAILAYAYGIPSPFIETNIRRAFIHHFFPKQSRIDDRDILPLVEGSLDRRNPREWYFALMDYGAYLRRLPANPNARSKYYKRQLPFIGSNRELRGKLLCLLIREGALTMEMLKRHFPGKSGQIEKLAEALTRDGFAVRRGKNIAIAS